MDSFMGCGEEGAECIPVSEICPRIRLGESDG